MRDISRFATEDWPLHPSGLRALMTCPWQVVMKYLYEVEPDEGGPAGDTGSATHAAIAELHRGRSLPQCTEAMIAGSQKYPAADLADAAGMFLAYAQDPRNRDEEVVIVETAIKFQISPAPEDPTQAPIQVIGTLDQVRRVRDGRLELWDVKTSKKDAFDLLQQHSLQAAAYCVGASILLGQTVHPGGLILTRKYGKGNPFWQFAWTVDDLEHILAGVRHQVARVRSGVLHHLPHDGCKWCHAKSPDLCLPQLKEYKKCRT